MSEGNQAPQDATGSFLKQRSTWLVIAAFVLLGMTARLMPLGWHESAMQGLDPASVRLGLGILLCVAFLWLTEALPLAATALMVPLLATLLGISDMKDSLAPFRRSADFPVSRWFRTGIGDGLPGSGPVDRAMPRAVCERTFHSIPALLLFAVTAFLSMWMSNTATTAMMIPLAMGILGRMGPDGQRPGKYAICFLVLPTRRASAAWERSSAVRPTASPHGNSASRSRDWLKFGIPAVLILMPVMAGVIGLICRPDKGLRITLRDRGISPSTGNAA